MSLSNALSSLRVTGVAIKAPDFSPEGVVNLDVTGDENWNFRFLEKDNKYFVKRYGREQVFTLNQDQFERVAGVSMVDLKVSDADESPTFYISTDSGELMSVRNTRWRIFDFVWMLHIMDYEERDDFNRSLLIIAASLALLFTLSGGYLVVKSFKKKDFGLKN